jgi:hypothetical protein
MRRFQDFTFILLALILLIGCSQVSDLISDDPEKLLVLTISPTSIAADGASTSTITAQIPRGIDPNDRAITFSTSAGLFLDGAGTTSNPVTIDADAHGVAVVQLQSPLQQGLAIVRAKNGSIVKQGKVRFLLAQPTQILVSSDSFILSISALETATMTATLTRAGGVASEGTVVKWSSLDLLNAPIGGFSSITLSDAAGQATAVFNPGATIYRGDLIIRATVMEPGTTAVILGETIIQIVD